MQFHGRKSGRESSTGTVDRPMRYGLQVGIGAGLDPDAVAFLRAQSAVVQLARPG
jgi:hypothetical protein